MINNAGLALMAKIHNLMSNNEANQSMSFLTLAESWDMQQIAFNLPLAEAGLSELSQANYSGTFSRRVNVIPGKGVQWSNTNIFLWDVYRRILEGPVSLARRTSSNNEDDQYKDAKELLGSFDAPSEKYKIYLAYRDKVRTLEQQIRMSELTLTNVTKEEIRVIHQKELDSYLNDLQFLNNDWTARGFKNEIEEAFQILNQANSGNFTLQWKRWRDDFIVPGPQNDKDGEYWPTGYHPENLYKGEGWVKFTIDQDEVTHLSDQAPNELKRFQDSLGDQVRNDGAISQISMEIARIDVERMWLHPELWHSDFWRWSDPGFPPLSTGSASSTDQSMLPKYIVGLVLIRNLEITWNVPPKQNESKIVSVLGNIALDVKTLIETGNSVSPLPGEKLIKLITSEPGGFIDPRPDSLLIDLNRLGQPDLKEHLIKISEMGSLDLITRPSNNNPVFSFSSASEHAESETGSPTSVMLLGYILQQVAKSPNPDPNLSW